MGRFSKLSVGPCILCCRGDFSEAHGRLTEAVRLRNAMPASASAGKGAKIDSLGIDGIALWMLGYPDQAVSSAEEGVRAAQESGNPYDLAFALINLHIVVQFRREFAKASEIAERALRIIEEKKFEWLRTSIVWSLYACQTLGAERTEIDQVKEGFDDYFASEAKLYRPTNCTVLAECCVLNQPELGLSMIEQAVSGILETDQRMTEPDTWRVKGDLVLRLGSKDGRSIGPASREEAEVCFRSAVEIARAQGSKMLELRATASHSCWSIRPEKPRPATRWPKFSAGLPKVLIHRIFSKPGSCWKECRPDGAAAIPSQDWPRFCRQRRCQCSRWLSAQSR